MTEQQKLTFPMLMQQLDPLMLRDKQRFARRLHGVKKVKNPDAQQAIYQEMAKEIEQAAGKVVLREAARPAITYPENLPVSQKKQEILEAVRDHQVVIVAGETGSGKTTLLTETLTRLQQRVPCAVIEGDQQTVNDAERIRATGTPAIQVNTGKGCHLDAQMISDAMQRLPLDEGGIMFIENVGNLVCPASFDLGERHKVAVLSVTEGEDKPLKYPHMFAAASIMLLNKVDLLPYLNFDVEKCLAAAREVNPDIAILLVSATRGDGMDAWLDWLEAQRCA